MHTHLLVVTLFLILFASKAVLLFLNRHKTLDRAKRYTRALDIIFGILILVTGGYLLFQYNGLPGWLLTKVLLVLLAIPLGIVGIKRHSKLLTALSLLLFLYVYGVSETKSLTMRASNSPDLPDTPETDAVEVGATELNQPEETPQEIMASVNETQLANARAIYTQVCAACHGADGGKQLGGAPDLRLSNLSLQDRVNVIDNGRGLMPAFGGQLNDEEVQALAAYTMTLKN